MAAPDWSFFATQLSGSGSETLAVADLPLGDGAQISLGLSGGDSIQGTIPTEVGYLIGPDRQPILRPWQTAIYATQGDVIRCGGILRAVKISGSSLALDVVGFSAYPAGMPWTDETKRLYQIDAAEAYRLIWRHVQSKPRGNLGLQVSPEVSSGVKLGVKTMEPFVQPKATSATKTTQTSDHTIRVTTAKSTTYAADSNTVVTTTTTVKDARKAGVPTTYERRIVTAVTYAKSLERTTTTEVWTGPQYDRRTSRTVATVKLAAGTKVKVREDKVKSDEPFVLSSYETHDLGQKLGEIAEAGGLEFREMHQWDGANIAHRLVLGHPRVGRRRQDLALAVGINCAIPDAEINAEAYASEVLVVGAGEAEKMIRAVATNATSDRLRRVQVVSRKGIGRMSTATATAARLAKLSNARVQDVESITVWDHPLASLTELQPGDEIYLEGPSPWLGTLGQWVRVLSITYTPKTPSQVTIGVTRADKAW